MKRYRICALALSLLICLSFTCCEASAPRKGGSSLCSWVDDSGFAEGLSQREYIEVLDGFSLNGKPLTTVAPYAFFENAYGGGCSGSCNSFSYGQEQSVGEETLTVSYLSFSAEIDGLDLPYDIQLGDSFSSILAAFGYSEHASFITDGEGAKLLTEKEGEQLVLRNLAVLSSETEYLYPYQLVYTERYSATGSGGNKATVERSLDLYFSKGVDPALSMVRIHLYEEI